MNQVICTLFTVALAMNAWAEIRAEPTDYAAGETALHGSVVYDDSWFPAAKEIFNDAQGSALEHR